MDATLKTSIGGQLVELPGTIAAIRAAMGEAEAAAFDREIEHLPVADLPAALVRWALAGTPADQEDSELFDRLSRGEDIDAVPADRARPESP
jgi:microcompartment protein CcmL/EutN